MKTRTGKAEQALELYLEQIRNELPQGAGLAEIEAAMIRHNSELLLGIMESLQNEQALFPPTDSGRVEKSRGKGKPST